MTPGAPTLSTPTHHGSRLRRPSGRVGTQKLSLLVPAPSPLGETGFVAGPRSQPPGQCPGPQASAGHARGSSVHVVERQGAGDCGPGQRHVKWAPGSLHRGAAHAHSLHHLDAAGGEAGAAITAARGRHPRPAGRPPPHRPVRNGEQGLLTRLTWAACHMETEWAQPLAGDVTGHVRGPLCPVSHL